MEKKRQYLLFALLAGFLLYLGLVFQQELLANIILPAATVVWLLLRIFVLSIDQQIYWWLLIFLVGLIALIRLFRDPGAIEPDQLPDANPTLDRVRHWQTSILSNIYENGERNYLKADLRRLLTTMYSARRPGSAHFEIEAALEQRQISLPEPIYTYLCADQPVAPRQTFIKHPVAAIKQTLRMAPQRWLRRWTGREAAEYYEAIDEVLTLMETSLEMKYDDDPSATRNH